MSERGSGIIKNRVRDGSYLSQSYVLSDCPRVSLVQPLKGGIQMVHFIAAHLVRTCLILALEEASQSLQVTFFIRDSKALLIIWVERSGLASQTRYAAASDHARVNFF